MNIVISRDQLKLLLETMGGEIPKIIINFEVQTRIEHDNFSTRVYLSLRRKKFPNKEIAKVTTEFISVMDAQKNTCLHFSFHHHCFVANLTEPEFIDIYHLIALYGMIPYQFANDTKK
ncbi:MAG: hypothetical protein HZA35_02265 [Parcubacteria group bacterium]|nr:hypothetical protein [Parcubacteria group bacterium]